jgi:mannose-1-phosphate guanylyltransferase/mannose-6-phosphate isomerase
MHPPINLVPVILCGGSGTRLWPLSRSAFPKQFLAINSPETLFQQALLRAEAICSPKIFIDKTIVVTNEEHRFLAFDQYQEIASKLSNFEPQFLLEPTGKNTAPALTLAALQATRGISNQNDPILFVTPADQTIEDNLEFVIAIRKAVTKANDGTIVVMGISPNRAESGYGYIQRSGTADELGAYAIQGFTEKPNQALAQQFIDSGEYSWNGGIFILKASVWLKAIQKFRPDILSGCESSFSQRDIDHHVNGVSFIRPNREAYFQIPAESIDYAVMEKCSESEFSISMIPLNVGWSDLGNWDAIWKAGKSDADGNVIQGDIILNNTKNSLIHATTRLVSLVGVTDLIVIETADAVLIADRHSSQDVKVITQQLEKEGREQKNLHRKVNRPWGWYDTLDEGGCFKVKRIQVKPGASLSLQMHHHRAEHWIVVKGIAEVTNGDRVITLQENQSTYIPQGQVHRLANPGSETLEIIEVQSGSYLGEDDIVRIEDVYGRN